MWVLHTGVAKHGVKELMDNAVTSAVFAVT